MSTMPVFSRNGEIRTREFLDETLFSDSMLDNILGPVAFLLLHDRELDVTRYNRKFFEEIKVPSFNEYLKSIQRMIIVEDLPVLYDLFSKAKADPAKGAIGVIRFRRLDGPAQYRFHVYFVDLDGEGERYYCTVQDLAQYITLDDHMRLLSQVSSDTIMFLRQRGTQFAFRVVIHGLSEEMGLTSDELQHELNDGRFSKRVAPSVSREMKTILLGSKTGTELCSKPFYLATNNGDALKLQVKCCRVHDEASEVEHILTFQKLAS